MVIIIVMSDFIELHSCCIEKSTMSFPMGALCIKTAINSDGELPKSNLYSHTLGDDSIQEAINCVSRNPKAVGISVYIWNLSWFESFAKKVKELSPDTMIFAGGPGCTFYEEKFPSFLSFAVKGEGEESTIDALKSCFSGKETEKIIYSKTPDLNKLESVFLSGNADSALEGTDSVLWELTRGCPFKCAFCFESRGNRTVRDYPLKRITEELDYLIDKEIRNVFVLDPTFNLNRERAKEILKLLIDRAPAHMHFTFEIRAELLDSEMAELFGTLNCSLQIGLQSSNPEILKTINRDFNSEDFSKHVKLLTATGAAYGFDIIIGLPGDSLKTFRETVNYAVSLMPSNIDCFTLSLLPATELALKEKEYGYKTASDIEKTIVSSPTFPSEDIAEALKIKKAMNLFYTKGQACMWIHCVLETLNISACNLFLLFDKWMEQTGRTEDEDIWILQDEFVSSLFEKTQNTKLLSALKSFMELHQGICYVTDTGESAVLDLKYSPDDLALLDTMSLSEFVKTHKLYRCSPVIELDDDGSICFR